MNVHNYYLRNMLIRFTKPPISLNFFQGSYANRGGTHDRCGTLRQNNIHKGETRRKGRHSASSATARFPR